jgi:hypothetical protein
MQAPEFHSLTASSGISLKMHPLVASFPNTLNTLNPGQMLRGSWDHFQVTDDISTRFIIREKHYLVT